jgi:lysophospholipase L1-like esterase
VLTDVSCSGATTAHLLGPWDELPPQLDAVDSATRLVTVTIGGNDLGYMTVLGAGACHGAPAGRTCRDAPPTPSDSAYVALQQRLTAIARRVQQQAPQARLVFVQYFTVMPPTGSCAAMPLNDADAAAARTMARRLAEVTARAAASTGADVLPLDSLSASHHACAADAWSNGDLGTATPTDGVSFHPRQSGMTAAARALHQLLDRSRR